MSIPRLITNLKLVRDDSHVMHHPAIEEVIAVIKELTWVPVAERLPSKAGPYSATKELRSGERVIVDEFFDSNGYWINADVIAWKPHDKPYKDDAAIDAASGERK